VLAGLGFAIGSAWLFAPELKSGSVQTVLTDWLLPTVDLWAVFPMGRQASVKARAFASSVTARCRAPEQLGVAPSFPVRTSLTSG
jgi:DNA-binding transcriptional LysR family regulator